MLDAEEPDMRCKKLVTMVKLVKMVGVPCRNDRARTSTRRFRSPLCCAWSCPTVCSRSGPRCAGRVGKEEMRT